MMILRITFSNAAYINIKKSDGKKCSVRSDLK